MADFIASVQGWKHNSLQPATLLRIHTPPYNAIVNNVSVNGEYDNTSFWSTANLDQWNVLMITRWLLVRL